MLTLTARPCAAADASPTIPHPPACRTIAVQVENYITTTRTLSCAPAQDNRLAQDHREIFPPMQAAIAMMSPLARQRTIKMLHGRSLATHTAALRRPPW